jgi:hypothetical protein
VEEPIPGVVEVVDAMGTEAAPADEVAAASVIAAEDIVVRSI